MCGIFATTASREWQPRLDRVLAALGARGPDGHGWSPARDQEPLLAHTRLAVLGLGAAGAQPATSSDGQVDVTFNGEIYNFASLAAAHGITSEGSDTRVLVELLSGQGDDALASLRGMYAFVAWDRRTDTLLAMRDPYGIKPLYVLRQANGEVTLASELPALLLSPEARRLDEVGLGQFLALGHTGPTLTTFSAVSKLVPGTLYRWRRYQGRWLASTSTPQPPPARQPLAVDEAVADSVAAHLVADVDVGVFLSGGVDSTLLTALAARQGPGLHAFTVTFPESPELDEGPRAAENATLLGARHTLVPATRRELAGCARTFLRQHGEPFGDAAVMPLTHLAAAAAQEVKVVLTGEGADEVFGGYARYDVQRRLGATSRRLRPLTAPMAGPWGRRRSGAPWARALEAALHGGGADAHVALLDGDLPVLADVRSGIADDVRAMLRTRWSALETGPDAGPLPGQEYDRRCWLPNVYLEKADRATMAAGLEARVPFLDPVVERAARATSSARAGKAPLRAALLDLLPDARLPPRKLGLAVDIRNTVSDHLEQHLRYELLDSGSVLHRWAGLVGARRMAQRAARSPTLRFRLAMLGLWEDEFGGESYT